MSIDITFDVIKWVVSGVVLVGSAVFGWIVKFVVGHVKEQRTNTAKADLFRNDIADRIEKVITKSDTISAQVQSIQVFMEAQFEVNPVALFICDNTGKCTHANDSLLVLFRAQATEMLGFGWQNFIHPEDRARVHDAWMSAITRGNNDIRDHYRIIDRDEYDTNGRALVVATVRYKTIFKYDADKQLKVAVGTVWEIDSEETDHRILKCIAETLDSMKGTPLWMQMQQQIKDKKK